MKTYLIAISLMFLLIACGPQESARETPPEEQKGLVGYVDLSEPLEEELIQQGASIFSQKCASCHTIDTVEFAVPAFAGVTNRRSPEWIMNMILNVDEMLLADSTARALLKRHKKIMPDPELTVEQARAMLEFFRYNDEEQVGSRDAAARR
jgi:mono/diheme cytochrome c family protein